MSFRIAALPECREEFCVGAGGIWLIPPETLHDFPQGNSSYEYLSLKFLCDQTVAEYYGTDTFLRYNLEHILQIINHESHFSPFAGEGKEILETRPLLCCQNLIAGQPRPRHNRCRHAGQNTAANDLGKSRKQPAGRLAGTKGAVRICIKITHPPIRDEKHLLIGEFFCFQQSDSIKSSMLHNRTWASCSKVSAAALLMFFARISYC